MKRQLGPVTHSVLCALTVVALVSGTAVAEDVAYDMVGSTSRNLVSYSTDAPEFGSPGDGFQKYTVGVSESIPYAIVDDSADVYPADTLGIIDSASDFDEFFGICDIVNDDNTEPLHATWVFDISSAEANVELHVDLGAMGDFEPDDSYVLTYQIDGGPVTTFLSAVVDEDGSMSYELANGIIVDLDDPLTVDGITLYNELQTFSTSISTGSELTVELTSLTDGGSEAFVLRNIMVTSYTEPVTGGQPIPTASATGIAVMVLLLVAGGVFLLRRMR